MHTQKSKTNVQGGPCKTRCPPHHIHHSENKWNMSLITTNVSRERWWRNGINNHPQINQKKNFWLTLNRIFSSKVPGGDRGKWGGSYKPNGPTINEYLSTRLHFAFMSTTFLTSIRPSVDKNWQDGTGWTVEWTGRWKSKKAAINRGETRRDAK